jgi:hypothetical protein
VKWQSKGAQKMRSHSFLAHSMRSGLFQSDHNGNHKRSKPQQNPMPEAIFTIGTIFGTIRFG